MALPGMGDERFVTMSLGTRGHSTMPNSKKEHFNSLKLGPEAGRPTNMVHDITGAQPAPVYKYTEKPSFYEPRDIRGTTSKVLIRNTNSVDCQLKIDDIDGAQPKPYTFKTNRVVDPLLPAYKLPSAKMAAPLEPKFIRDSYCVSDIEGTKPRPLYPMDMRDNYSVTDIDGAQSGWRPRNQRARLEGAPLNNEFDVRDINNVGFKSTRTVCPLKPEYRVHGMVIKDDPKYTQPRPLPPAARHDFYSLKTDDIEGAWPGWVPPHECQPPVDQRRHFRNTNFVGDIKGAQHDTVQHAIRTDRVVNPLNPVYDSLDGDRLAPPLTPNLLNGDPEKFGLSQPDAFKDKRQPAPQQGSQRMVVTAPQPQISARDSARDSARLQQPQVSARESARGSARLVSARMASARGDQGADGTAWKPSASVPPMDLATMRGHGAPSARGGSGRELPPRTPKDAEIARLENELSTLKASYGGGGGFSGRQQPSARAQPPAMLVRSARSPQGSARGFSATQAAVSARRQSTTSFVASARESARSARGGGASARASARQSAALAADIAAVQEL